MLALITFTEPDLRRPDGGSVATLLAQPKRFALVAYLRVAAPGAHVRRDQLLALFWPESSEERARGSLRQALQFLRRSLGADAVLTRGDDEVGIDPGLVTCDMDAVHQALRSGDVATALSLAGGDFLPGLHVDDAPGITQWIDDTRRVVRAALVDAAVTRAESDLAAGDAAAARALLRRVDAIAALHEPRHRLLLRTLDALGDRAGALAEHEAFTRRLAEELDVAPSPETQALVRAIAERTDPGPGAALPAAPRLAAAEATLADGPGLVAVGTPERSARWRWWVGAATVFAVVALAFAPWLDRVRGSAPGAPRRVHPRVLVLPLDNETGADTLAPLGRMAADWITEGLSRVEGIEVVPGTAVLTLERALVDSLGGATRELRREQVVRELGATAVVSGATYRTGATLHLQARVHDAATSQLLRPAITVSVPLDSVMTGVDALRRALVAGFAPMLDTATHFRRAMPPPSFEAYRDLVSGFQAFVTGDVSRAMAAWERSAAAGSEYPMAELALVIAHYGLDETDAAWARLQALAPRSAALGPVEQSTFEMIDGMLRGDLPRAHAAVRRAAAVTPGSINDYMVAELDRRLNRPAQALDHLRSLGAERGELRGWRAYWRELSWSQLMLGDAVGALAAARTARQRYPDDRGIVVLELRALAALGRVEELDQLLDSTARAVGPLAEGVGASFRLAAELLAPAADSTVRRRWLARSEGWYLEQRRSRRPVPPGLSLGLASTWVAQGRMAEAIDLLQVVDRESPGRWDVWQLLGIASARAGDSTAAARWQEALARFAVSLPESRRGTEGPALMLAQAQVAAQRGRLEEASALLEAALARGLSASPEVFDHPWLRPLSRGRGPGTTRS